MTYSKSDDPAFEEFYKEQEATPKKVMPELSNNGHVYCGYTTVKELLGKLQEFDPDATVEYRSVYGDDLLMISLLYREKTSKETPK